MRNLPTLLAGVLTGAAAWALGSWLSGVFEPFDSLTGFLTTQVVMGGTALLFALKGGGGRLAFHLLGCYVGLNLYPYVLGGTESRVWALLAMVTTLSLLVVPLVAGAVGLIVRRARLAPRDGAAR